MTTIRGNRECEDDELTTNFASYLSIKKSKRIIFHDQLSEVEHEKHAPRHFKLDNEYNPNKIDLEKDIFEELMEQLDVAFGSDKVRMVVHGLNVTPKMLDPRTMRVSRGIIVSRSFDFIDD